MSKYAFLRSNASLIIIGSLLGLIGGFKIANSQYRSQQSEVLKRDIARATNGLPGSQAEVNAIIERAKANPNDAEAQVQAASQFIQIERPEEAMPFLEQARTIRPNDPRVSAGLGVAHFMMGQYDQAKDWLKRSHDQGADDPTVTGLLIGSYIRTGKNLDEAERLVSELEAKGVEADKIAQIRQELNAARSGKTENPAATPQPRTVLSHGSEGSKSVK
ncbi:MAG TPA: tetratricopeptide repeat protein [Blastocatellia bacterium]|jgi:tetratricopeptide (TPR) repeat protein|nr:tetratricopeptide repeat protein [Blastocatellia bacterium]